MVTRVAPHGRAPDPCAFYHVHSFTVRADQADVLGTAEYGAPFVSAVEHGDVFGVQFHPEKSGPSGLALLPTSSASAPPPRSPAKSRRDPPPRDRHPRRPGGAARAGTLRSGNRLRQRSARGGARLGRAGRRATSTSSTSTARAGKPVNLGQLERIASELAVPVQFGGGLRSADACIGGVRRRARTGDSRHTPPTATRVCWPLAVDQHGDGLRWPSTCARGASRWRVG